MHEAVTAGKYSCFCTLPIKNRNFYVGHLASGSYATVPFCNKENGALGDQKWGSLNNLIHHFPTLAFVQKRSDPSIDEVNHDEHALFGKAAL